jgi:hypothetical protein
MTLLVRHDIHTLETFLAFNVGKRVETSAPKLKLNYQSIGNLAFQWNRHRTTLEVQVRTS